MKYIADFEICLPWDSVVLGLECPLLAFLPPVHQMNNKDLSTKWTPI